ncbi:MAG: T9SS type A sorting domain-containing protein [Tannerellaceae bacterium]|nr:T9SS type A sorting domain-containing protein [Tannerellaceae bacterium]
MPTKKSRQNPPPIESIQVNRNAGMAALTPEELILQVFLNNAGQTCATGGLVQNVQFHGLHWSGTAWTDTDHSLSFFDHGELAFGDDEDGEPTMPSGILMTTGGGNQSEGPNAFGDGVSGSSGAHNTSADPDLLTLIPQGHVLFHGAILEFDFTPQEGHISFEYVFASEEYPNFVGGTVSDVFGFFIWRPDIPGDPHVNIATLPTTMTATNVVSINNVNWGQIPYANNNATDYGAPLVGPQGAHNPEYYTPVYSNAPFMEYSGRTVKLSAEANVIPGVTYHLKLAISNVGDDGWGSGVFLKAGSFSIGTGITNWVNNVSGVEHMYEGCSNSHITIAVTPSSQPLTLNIAYSGAAAGSIVKPDGTAMPTAVVVPPNNSSVDIPYRIINNPTEGDLVLTIGIPGCGGNSEATLHVHKRFIHADPVVTSDCGGATRGSLAVNVTGGYNPKFSVDNGATWTYATDILTGLAQGSYTVKLTEDNACFDSTFTVYIPRCYDVLPENYTVQEYQEILLDVLANDILPSYVFATGFNLLDNVTMMPKAGVLTVAGSGADSKLIYRNHGIASLTNNIDSLKYEFTVQNPVTLAIEQLSATVFIYVLSDQNGAATCPNSPSPYTIQLLVRPASTAYKWTTLDGSTVVHANSSTHTSSVSGPTESWLITPTVPNAATLYNGGFPDGFFSLFVNYNGAPDYQMIWTGVYDSNWNDPANWVQMKNGVQTPVQWAPTNCADVVIPSSVNNFPEIVSNATCRDILVKDRAMLKNPHGLTYHNASVEIKLKPSELDRFVMWSAPLADMYSGDYYYTNNAVNAPQGDAFMNLFQQANPDADVTSSAAAHSRFTATMTSVGQQLEIGRAFNLKVVSNSVTRETALSFPRAANSYLGVNLPNRGNKNKFIIDGITLNANRRFQLRVYGGTGASYPFNNAGWNLIQVVNPYMAYLNIDSFITNNAPNFQNGYYIWNGELNASFTSVAFNPGGNRYEFSGTVSNPTQSELKWIPPLQSFFVAKAAGVVGNNIQTVWMSPNWTTTKPVDSYTLRASNVISGGKLNITATQGSSTASALLLYDMEAGFITSKNNLPVIIYNDQPLSVYTYSGGNEALQVNSSSMFDAAPVRLGFRNAEAGEVTLNFSGLESFGYDVVLEDRLTNKQISLSPSKSTYTFMAAKPVNTKALESNERFLLRMGFTGKGITFGYTDTEVAPAPFRVFPTGQGIQIISNAAPTGNVRIYNMQGSVIYSASGINISSLLLPLTSGRMYIVQIEAGGTSVVEKVYLK